MPTLTIDGKSVTVPDGATVLQACEQASSPVPFYCYHPGLSIAGNCRICLVEIEKTPKLQIACYTPAAEGMVVHTANDTVLKGRQYGEQAELSAADVRDRDSRLERHAAIPCRIHYARHRLHHRVESRFARVSRIRAKAADGAVDQPGIDGKQGRGRKAEPCKRAGLEVFHQHVSVCNEIAQQLAALIAAQINGKAAFTAVTHHEE